MIPSIDDRLASVVRALTEVILPHLPPEASLAQEQAQLCIGQLQILRGQIDLAPAFEREELADTIATGRALADALAGYAPAAPALAAALEAASAADTMNAAAVRDYRRAVSQAIEALVTTVSASGNATDQAKLTDLVLEHEHARTQKDRAWFAPFGFDTL